MSERKNILQRINAVMREVTYIQKDKDVTGGGQNYKAVTYDALVAVIRAKIVDAGIVVYTGQVSGNVIVYRDPAKDVKMHLYSGEYVVTFACDDKPDDKLEVSVHAHAADNGDKAPGKCMTYATKSAILKTFMLETGENEESRAAGSEGLDTDSYLLQIDGIGSVEELREKVKAWAKEFAAKKDVDGWKVVKAAAEVRAKEFSE